MSLRDAFPVLSHSAYLNAGTYGPLPSVAAAASAAADDQAVGDGRCGIYGSRLAAGREELREAYADVLGANKSDVALTSCTSEGIVRVLAGLAFEPGDEIVTADDEHPGLAGPLSALAEQYRVVLKKVPLAQVPFAVGPRTRLVACSHVSWTTGAVAAPELADLNVPVLYDGAQAAGAIEVDLERLGASFYAAPGQKWLCGPEGLGMLWLSPEWHERLAMRGPTYLNFADPGNAELHQDARRFDAPVQSAPLVAGALAAYALLRAEGLPNVWARGILAAGQLEDRLASLGLDVAPRGLSTLVSWRTADAVAERQRFASGGVIVRDIPGTGLLRASVGAWNDETDLDRLMALLS